MKSKRALGTEYKTNKSDIYVIFTVFAFKVHSSE